MALAITIHNDGIEKANQVVSGGARAAETGDADVRRTGYPGLSLKEVIGVLTEAACGRRLEL